MRTCILDVTKADGVLRTCILDGTKGKECCGSNMCRHVCNGDVRTHVESAARCTQMPVRTADLLNRGMCSRHTSETGVTSNVDKME